MLRNIVKLKKNIYSNENSKLIINNAVGAFTVKGGALIISLLSLPAFIKYFDNQEVLGLWFTLLSVLSWILTFDLGIGNGLRNHLVPLILRNDTSEIKKYISSAYMIVGFFIFCITLVSFITFKYINWNLILNISVKVVSADTLNTTVFIVFSGIMLQLFLKLISSILYALQKSALTNLLTLVTSILILVFISISEPLNVSIGLISLAIFYAVAVNGPLLIATIWVFSKKLKKSYPSYKFYNNQYARNVLVLGGVFFWVQIMYMVLTTTNEYLISILTNPAMVVEYTIYIKMFSLIGTLFTLALTPIWSAVTKAVAENNILWVKKLYKNLKILGLFAVLAQFIIIPFLQIGINFWLQEKAIELNYFYAIIFALYGSIIIWNSILSSIANGFGQLKTQSLLFTIGVIMKFPLSWYFVTLLESWIGVIIASIISMSLYSAIQPFWLNKYLNNKEYGDEVNV